MLSRFAYKTGLALLALAAALTGCELMGTQAPCDFDAQYRISCPESSDLPLTDPSK